MDLLKDYERKYVNFRNCNVEKIIMRIHTGNKFYPAMEVSIISYGIEHIVEVMGYDPFYILSMLKTIMTDIKENRDMLVNSRYYESDPTIILEFEYNDLEENLSEEYIKESYPELFY